MTAMNPNVRIETPRLMVRSPAPGDLDAMCGVFCDELAMRFVKAKETREQVQARMQRRIDLERERGFTMWTVERREDGEIVGDCGLAPLEGTGPLIEVGYHFAPPHWGAGYATECTVTVLRHGFNELKLDHIVAVAQPDNAASIRVMQKSGMQFVRNTTYKGTPVVMYEARAESWAPKA
jgi:ribosomal-protein-alanine N-acetyltransferase